MGRHVVAEAALVSGTVCACVVVPHNSRTMPNSTVRPRSLPIFVQKLLAMLDESDESLVAWCAGGSTFCVRDPRLLSTLVLPTYVRVRRHPVASRMPG